MMNSDPPLLADIEDEDRLDAWADYLGGNWDRGQPQLPGIYPVATLEGHFVGYREWKEREGRIIDPYQAVNEPGWQGYRWSVALPPPPKDQGDPAPDPATRKELQLKLAAAIRANDEWRQAAASRREIEKQIRLLEERREDLKEREAEFRLEAGFES